jgi:cardiolipin synthase
VRRAPLLHDDRSTLTEARALANQAFSRAAGAPLIPGNHVRLLRNAQEIYPAWQSAIRAARDHVHFENYLIYDDEAGRELAGALIERARAGVKVRLLHDWLGSRTKASRGFWRALRAGGVEVRSYNPPRLDSPLGWLSRDHRKTLEVDGAVGFVSGVCVGRPWLGDPTRGIEPWRDTGVEIRGYAVGAIEKAFARMWAMTGPPIAGVGRPSPPVPAGVVSLRIVASEPSTAEILRLDQLVAALARTRLWLTDAYYAGTTVYVQALRSAAKDGVDVRLLLPNATDIPWLQPLSRAGYRALLEAGVRIFEWNGPMLHAKTAVADGRWARVGSSNLNISSWFGNCELDAVVEDESFARQMEAMYLDDLDHATEIVLVGRRRLRASGGSPPRRRAGTRVGGSTNRAAAGAVRIGNTIGAALTNHRVLGPVEARLTMMGGVVLFVLSLLFALFPRALAYPLVAMGAWAGLALLYRGYRLRRSLSALRASEEGTADERSPETGSARAGGPER